LSGYNPALPRLLPFAWVTHDLPVTLLIGSLILGHVVLWRHLLPTDLTNAIGGVICIPNLN
jgi:hypothetical protein